MFGKVAPLLSLISPQSIYSFFMSINNQNFILWAFISFFVLLIFLIAVIIYKTIIRYTVLFFLLIKGDIYAVHQALEKDIFENHKFSARLLSYYVLVCMKIGVPCKLKDIEKLTQQGPIKTKYGSIAHIFSITYLIDEEPKTWKEWYLAIFLRKDVVHQKIIHLDYALKLISNKFYAEALEEFIWLSHKKLYPYMELLTVYSIDILCSKLPTACTKNPYLQKTIQKSIRSLHKKLILKHYHPAFYDSSGIGIRALLLKSILKEAIEWLNHRFMDKTAKDKY